MIQVALLNEEQLTQLVAVEYMEDCFFNPIQDADGNWVISLEELTQCRIEWVKTLPLIDFNPVTTELT
jgi:hypothetical protein